MKTFLSLEGFCFFQVWRRGAAPVLGVQDSRTARLLTREGYETLQINLLVSGLIDYYFFNHSMIIF